MLLTYSESLQEMNCNKRFPRKSFYDGLKRLKPTVTFFNTTADANLFKSSAAC